MLGRNRFQPVVGFVLLIWVSFTSNSSVAETLSIRKVVFKGNECVVTHKGKPEKVPFSIRVNANVTTAAFRQWLELVNCRVDASKPLIELIKDPAPRFFLGTNNFVDKDIDFSTDVLLEDSLGKLLKITRVVKSEAVDPMEGKGTPDKPKTEEIPGQLIGFKRNDADKTKFTLKLIRDNERIISVDSGEIVDISFLESKSDLHLVLERRKQFDTGLLNFVTIKGDGDIQVKYIQSVTDNHDWQIFNKAQLTAGNDSANVESWAEFWNDTFYDWQDVTVIFQIDEKTEYEIGKVNLRCGQKGTFRITSGIPQAVSVKRHWEIVPTSPTAASKLEIKLNSASSIPPGKWAIRDKDNQNLANEASAGKVTQESGVTISLTEDTTIILYKSDNAILEVRMDGNRLDCTDGSAAKFTLDKTTKIQPQFLTSRAILAGDKLAFTATTVRGENFPIIVKPALDGGKFHSAMVKGNVIEVRIARNAPTSPPVVSRTVLNSDVAFLRELTRNSHNPVLGIRQLIPSKEEIEKVAAELVVLEKQRKDLVDQERVGEGTIYRAVMRRELAQRIERKDAEILEKRGEIAKHEFTLVRTAESIPTPTAAIRALGGEALTDKSGRLVSVRFKPSSDITDSQLMEAIDGATNDLQSLVLSGCAKIMGNFLEKLEHGSLQWLDLSDTGVDGSNLISLANFPRLKGLSMAGNDIPRNSWDWIDALARLMELEYLNLAGTSFGDQELKRLCSFMSLKRLNIRSTLVTQRGHDRFKSQRPEVDVLYSSIQPPEEIPVPTAYPQFAKASFWYQLVDKEIQLHPNSERLVAEFLSQKKAGKDDLVGINTVAFAGPIYVAGKNTSPVKFKIDRCLTGVNDETYDRVADQMSAVTIPDFAEPADGSDSEMIIYNSATDTLWEIWRAKKTAAGWQACWGGRIDKVKDSNGIFAAPLGCTASCLPLAGGQITAEELEAGEIKHAMGIALTRTAKNELFYWPAGKSDGEGCQGDANCDEEFCIREGQRFRLDPTVDVDAMKMHPIGKVIARAAQQYGFVVWDKAGTTSLRATNPKSYTKLGGKNPYPDLFCPRDQWTVLDGFPWDKLQFLPENYGRPDISK